MNNESEVKELVNQLDAVVLYFKNDQCGPCQVLRPKVEEMLAASFPKIQMIVVDSVKNPTLSQDFNVFANPTILVFFDGKEYLRKSKYVSIAEFEKELDRLYQLAF